MDIKNLTLPQAPFPDVDTTVYFSGRKVILFGLPGAFTPTCSTKQLPGYEAMFEMFQSKGIDDIICTSVNDAFVMGKWFADQDIANVKWIADGSGILTEKLDMLVRKDNLGFGARSWRYAAVINNGIVEQMFAEEGKCDDHGEDPYDISSPENVYEKL